MDNTFSDKLPDVSALVEILKNHRTFIQTHNFPDPDAVASAFGLQQLLLTYGIETDIIYKGRIEKVSTLKMLPSFGIRMYSEDEISDMTSDDYIITVDAQKYNANCEDFIGDEVACIDHHPTVYDCDYAYKDIRQVGACSTIIADYYFTNGKQISEVVATALLYGIKMDTAHFTRGVTQLDIKMYYYLFPFVNTDILSQLQLNTMEFTDLKAYGNAIQNIQVYENIGFAHIPFDCPDGLIAMISDFILSLDVVEFAIVYAKRGDGFKFSVRSEIRELDAGKITANALAGVGNGGGHAVMAGGFAPAEKLGGIHSDINSEIENRFINAVAQFTK